MEIRPAILPDVDRLAEIDATIDSARYLCLHRDGEGLTTQFKIQERPLREKLIDPNRPGDELRFSLRQFLGGIEEGVSLVFEHEGELNALAVARLDAPAKLLRLLDLRVDYDFRRQGIGSALLYALVAAAREAGSRAVYAETPANNFPAAQFLSKAGFELTGFDTHLRSNHDLVKESVALFWYIPLD